MAKQFGSGVDRENVFLVPVGVTISCVCGETHRNLGHAQSVICTCRRGFYVEWAGDQFCIRQGVVMDSEGRLAHPSEVK